MHSRTEMAALILPTHRLRMRTPRDFSFARTAFSHGWYALPPFAHDASAQRVTRLLSLADGTLVRCDLRGQNGSLAIRTQSGAPLTASQRREIAGQLRACFRLQEDFSAFHRVARRYREYRWIASSKSGRLLRAPTVFEDIIKMICTTNCTWSLTTMMVRNLVDQLGAAFPDGTRAFPTPEAIASAGERFLRKSVKAGYRAPYLLECARRVTSGELDIESWRDSDLPSGELFTKVRSVKGIGPYAAGNMLKLLGRYDYLGLDSWVRARYAVLHARGRRVKDRTIERHYTRYGRWRGLFFWLEMTRHWHDGKFPPI